MRILLLDAYDAASHRQWRKGLVAALPEHDWTVLTLPPRHFSWRIRGNPLTWSLDAAEVLDRPWDRLLATSMTDLATLRGLLPSLARVPTLLYFHENQFAYPVAEGAPRRLEPLMVNLYAALAADRLLFNSRHNRDTFLTGVAELLSRMPDGVPDGVAARLAGKSECLPVPLDDALFAAQPAPPDRLTLVWNHRWEYDKGPDRLALAMEKLAGMGIDFTLHVVGQRFRQTPPALTRLREKLGERIGVWGPLADRADYLALLRRAHVVLSTALHDFQGLAVLEAVACGCRPLVPDRLAYPEWFGPKWRYAAHGQDAQAEASALAARLAEWAGGRLPPAPDVGWLAWSQQVGRWREELNG